MLWVDVWFGFARSCGACVLLFDLFVSIALFVFGCCWLGGLLLVDCFTIGGCCLVVCIEMLADSVLLFG